MTQARVLLRPPGSRHLVLQFERRAPWPAGYVTTIIEPQDICEKCDDLAYLFSANDTAERRTRGKAGESSGSAPPSEKRERGRETARDVEPHCAPPHSLRHDGTCPQAPSSTKLRNSKRPTSIARHIVEFAPMLANVGVHAVFCAPPMLAARCSFSDRMVRSFRKAWSWPAPRRSRCPDVGRTRPHVCRARPLFDRSRARFVPFAGALRRAIAPTVWKLQRLSCRVEAPDKRRRGGSPPRGQRPGDRSEGASVRSARTLGRCWSSSLGGN